MWQYLNKKISSPLAFAIIIILVVSVEIVDYWQYTEILNIELEVAEIRIPEKKEKTVGLKTYVNEEYGFEFDYPLPPPECEVYENELGELRAGRTTVLNVKNSGGLTLSEYVYKKYPEESEEECIYCVESRKNITIGGKEAITVVYRMSGSSRYGEETFIKSNENIITLGFSAGTFCGGQKLEYIYEFEFKDAALKTFRFLD